MSGVGRLVLLGSWWRRPMRRAGRLGRRLVLKIGWPHADAAHEAGALRAGRELGAGPAEGAG